ncbi:MAG TPA: TonB-dependent receptor [Bacteroidia bacterium]|jgi:iron complex outermembrane receptor protein|nr:TonB-dependent receptor [Bacteroidia bacterium]
MNTIKRLITASAALIISLQFAQAQYTIKGVVKDAGNSQPIPGAAIAVPNTTTATSADAQGMFTLTSQSNFDSIVVTSIGYTSKRMAVSDKSQSLTIILTAASNSLDAVNILGIKTAQSVTTLTSDDLNRASGLKLQDALNLVPGVDMQAREPWGGYRITIRGYTPNLGSLGNLSVNTGSGYGYMAYINGIPITDATGNTILDDVDMSSLGMVQIIKGPSSALYGSYVGGSVNLFTPTVAPGTTSIQEQAIGGSYGLFRTTTTLATATEKSSIWVNYGGQTYSGFRPNDGSKSDFAEFALNYKISNKNSLSTFFSYNYSNQGLSGELDSDAVYGRQNIGDANYDLNNSKVTMESMRGGMMDQYTFNSHLDNQVSLFLTTRTIDQIIAHGYTDYQDGDWGGRDAFNFHYGAVDGIIGGSFQKLNQTSDGFSVSHTILPPFAPSQGSFSYAQNYAINANLFTQWAFSLPSSITLTVGASENFSQYASQNMVPKSFGGPFYNQPVTYEGSPVPAFTPSASLIKVFNENVSVYGSFGMGYTPPSLGSIINSANQIVTGLKPETAIQYELGTKGTLANSKLSYQLAVYDLDVTNRFLTEYVNGVSSTVNVGEQRDMGVELYMAYNIINDKSKAISLVRPWISYTYDDADYVSFIAYQKSKIGGNDSLYANYTGNKAVGVAPNTFNAGIDLNTNFGLYLHITYQYVDKVPFTFDNEHSMSAYGLLNGRLGYNHQFGKHFMMDAFVGVDNALGQTYYTSVFYAANIQDLAQGTDPNYLNAFKAIGINKPNIGSGGDGYILPAPYTATFYGGLSLKYTF